MCRTWPKSPQPLPEALLLESPLAHVRSSRTNFLPNQTHSCHVRTRRQNLPPPRKPRSQPHQPHLARTRTHNPSRAASCRNLRRGWTTVPRKALPWLHRKQHGTSHTQRKPVRNRIHKSARHRSSSTPESLTAVKPRIQAMIEDEVTAGPLPKQPLETRLAAVGETATSTYFRAFGDEDRATAKLYFRKAALAQDEAWQQTIGGPAGAKRHKPDNARLRTPSSASQDEDSEDMAAFTVDRSDSTQPSEEHKPLRRSLAAGHENRRLVPHDVSHKWLYHLEACAGSVLTPHDYITNVQKRLGNRACTGFGECRRCGSFLDPQLEHGRGHYACVHAVVCGLKLADSGITTEPRGLTASQSRPTEIFTAAAVPGRMDVCVASPDAAAAR